MGLICEWPPARSVTVLCHTCMWGLWVVQPLLGAKEPLCHVLGITASPGSSPSSPCKHLQRVSVPEPYPSWTLVMDEEEAEVGAVGDKEKQGISEQARRHTVNKNCVGGGKCLIQGW